MLDPVELFPEVPNLYEFPSIHADMVFDERRVRAYQLAIEETVKKGDVVVDVGAGTGLLSFLCLKAGAGRVHAIERASVIDWARKLAEKNGFADRIIFHHADAREIELGEKADLIVSELMGHIAFEEGMTETIYDASKRFLKPDGILIPKTVSLRAAIVSESTIYPEYVHGWGTICGIDYSVMRQHASRCTYVTDITDRDLLSENRELFSWDFSQPPRDVHQLYVFKAFRKGIANGVAFWFDAELTPTVKLSSNPWTKTHWQQCFVPFIEPITVVVNDELKITIQMIFRKSAEHEFVLNVEPVTSY